MSDKAKMFWKIFGWTAGGVLLGAAAGAAGTYFVMKKDECCKDDSPAETTPKTK